MSLPFILVQNGLQDVQMVDEIHALPFILMQNGLQDVQMVDELTFHTGAEWSAGCSDGR